MRRPRLAVGVGTEARGLSDAAVGEMDALVRVPMAGMVDSLNVAACAAVLLFEVVRQRAASGVGFAHTDQEAVAIRRHLEESNQRLTRGKGR